MESQSMGKRIMALRKNKGYTQEQLSEKLGVSSQAVSKWENEVSCPDISIVPQLAEVLGVTTDELLGVKSIEPHVVVVDSGRGEKSKKSGEGINFSLDLGKKDGIFFALTIILVGVAFLLSRLNVLPFSEVGFWGVVWPAVVLGLGVAWCVKRFSPFTLAVALLGLYYLLFNLKAITFVLTWGTVWPIALIVIGLTILWDKFVLGGKRAKYHYHAGDKTPVSEYTDSDGYVRYESTFNEDHRVLSSERFAGGKVDATFGKATLDLSACKSVVPGAVLNIDASFCSFELIVPRSIRAELQSMDKSFGSISVKGEPAFDAKDFFQIKGEVAFGSLVSRYV